MREQQSKKRKDDSQAHASAPKRARPNTSVFVSGLPLDASANEIADVFARYGVLLEDDDGHPRIKMYRDPETQAFKGEALVVYFKPESVDLAIQLLDDTYLRAARGVHSGPCMRVEPRHAAAGRQGAAVRRRQEEHPAAHEPHAQVCTYALT